MIREFWLRGLARARIYRRLTLCERPLSRPFTDVSARVPVHVSLLTPSGIDAYMAFRPAQSGVEIRRRLDEGQRCFAAWLDRQIIHAAWTVTGRAWIEYLSTEIPLAADEFYSYDVFTSPAFRGLGVSPARRLAMMRYFRDRGYRSQLGAILPESRSRLRLEERAGSIRAIGVVGYVGLGPWRRVFCRRDR